MSTRAAIVISECKVPLNEDSSSIILYHHSDGYPEGVGSELVDLLKKLNRRLSEINQLQSNADLFSWDWTPEAVANFITEMDMSYRKTSCIPDTIEYIYVIDTTKKRLSCYDHDGCSEVDLDMLGDKLEIPDNEFDGCQNNVKINPEFSQMFKTCSCVQGIEGNDVVFTDGTRVPVSQIGVPMHDPPFPAPKPDRQKPSYVQIDEKLELYKKIFLIVLPIILRRESHPFNYKLIMEQANDVTVHTMRQFSKMKEYYSEHI